MINNKNCNFVSAVVYVHNAESRITDFLKNIVSVLEENFTQSEIICVNDYSGDESVARIKKANSFVKSTSITILNMSSFHGLETSMNAGVHLSIGDFVFEFDTTEIDYDTSKIMEVYNKSMEGYDIVSAAPKKGSKCTSSIFYKLFNHFAKMQNKIGSESFRILSRRAINRIFNENSNIFYRKAVYASCGLKTAQVVYENTAKRKAKYNKAEKNYRNRLAVDSLILFTDVGYRFSKAMTDIMMFITILMIVYSLSIYFAANPVEGWTTTILFLSFAFFGLFFALTVVIKYLQILVNLTFKRKNYNFESIEKLTK